MQNTVENTVYHFVNLLLNIKFSGSLFAKLIIFIIK